MTRATAVRLILGMSLAIGLGGCVYGPAPGYWGGGYYYHHPYYYNHPHYYW